MDAPSPSDARAPDPLLAEIEMFLCLSKMTATEFGVDAMGDPNFVHQLRKGRECKRRTAARAREFMRGYVSSTPEAAP